MRLKGTKFQAKSRRVGKGNFGKGSEPHVMSPAKRSEERCKLPQRGSRQSPDHECILDALRAEKT